ncbi:ferredoxin [Marinobacterium sp. MBR-111]|jgi:ferredoxin|uniref:2Fe-2S iron-sulfur cluster binding domain-containing protein n=1 Tax=Marinobacterium sp. MBR-111 TaxID=3156463 RepID=UPI003396104C
MDTPVKFSIEIVDSDETFLCSSMQNVLEGMVRLGRRGIPSGCRGGGCGVCKIEVLQGHYRSKKMSRSHIDENDIEHGRVLACRIYPESDLVIRVIGKMKGSFEPS